MYSTFIQKACLLGAFGLLFSGSLIGQNGTSGQQNEDNPYPWTPLSIETITMADGSTKELHTISEEEYYRYWQAHPQMWVAELGYCRQQSGDCLNDVVITPTTKPKPKS